MAVGGELILNLGWDEFPLREKFQNQCGWAESWRPMGRLGTLHTSQGCCKNGTTPWMLPWAHWKKNRTQIRRRNIRIRRPTFLTNVQSAVKKNINKLGWCVWLICRLADNGIIAPSLFRCGDPHHTNFPALHDIAGGPDSVQMLPLSRPTSRILQCFTNCNTISSEPLSN